MPDIHQNSLQVQFEKASLNNPIIYGCMNYGRSEGLTQHEILLMTIVALDQHNKMLKKMLEDVISRTPAPIIMPAHSSVGFPFLTKKNN